MLRDYADIAARIAFIEHGRGVMPAWKNLLSPAGLRAVVRYEREVLAKQPWAGRWPSDASASPGRSSRVALIAGIVTAALALLAASVESVRLDPELSAEPTLPILAGPGEIVARPLSVFRHVASRVLP